MAADDPLEYQHLQREVSDVTERSCITGRLHRQFEANKLREHHRRRSRSWISSSRLLLREHLKEHVSEIVAVLRGQLDSILDDDVVVITCSESGNTHQPPPPPSSSHIISSSSTSSSLEKHEDRSIRSIPAAVKTTTDQSSEGVVLEIPDFSLLKHMRGDEVTAFLKSEWLKLRRQHESELHQKTEELFRAKREFAREKAEKPSLSSPVVSRKKEDGVVELDLELVKSKLLHTVAKLLDEMAAAVVSVEDNNYSCCSDCSNDDSDDDEITRSRVVLLKKDRIVGSLLHENERLRNQLAESRDEIKQLSSQLSDARNQIIAHQRALTKTEATKLLKTRVERLGDELEDLRIDRHLNRLLDSSILTEVFHNYRDRIREMDKDSSFLKELLIEKDDQMNIIYEDDRQKLKYQNDRLIVSSAAGSTTVLTQQQQVDDDDELLLTMLREKVCEQELMILESRTESDSMRRCLYEALQQIHACKDELRGLTETLSRMSVALVEAKQRNASLDGASIMGRRTAGSLLVDFDSFASMEMLSKAYNDFESRVTETINKHGARLTRIICQINPLVQQVAVLKNKELWYKQILEIKCSNLQKAEAEVDILGDEVDALLSVLGKIYIALDHYSPVLKHYPGVTDILRLVQKVLKGESS